MTFEGVDAMPSRFELSWTGCSVQFVQANLSSNLEVKIVQADLASLSASRPIWAQRHPQGWGSGLLSPVGAGRQTALASTSLRWPREEEAVPGHPGALSMRAMVGRMDGRTARSSRLEAQATWS